tara:strand:+ start:155 stop:643 length:489 start_codon:yes stop_codon:yes gene_type:complete
MDNLQSTYQAQFATFWNKAFPNKSCPPLPKKLDDIGLMEQIALRENDPILFQNLFRSDYSAMPADVATRLRNNALWTEDIEVLEKFGWTAKAKEMRAQVAEAERIILERKVAEAAERNAERDRKLEAYKNLDPMQKLAMNPPSPAAIAQAREQWGITGEPTY